MRSRESLQGATISGLETARTIQVTRDGSVVAAVNVSTSVTRVTRQRVVDEFVPQLLAATAAIDADLALV